MSLCIFSEQIECLVLKHRNANRGRKIIVGHDMISVLDSQEQTSKKKNDKQLCGGMIKNVVTKSPGVNLDVCDANEN
jgi:hypothetical protein